MLSLFLTFAMLSANSFKCVLTLAYDLKFEFSIVKTQDKN